MQTCRHDVLLFAREREDSELFIHLDSVVSRLKLKRRDAVIAKTPYLRWNLVKFITMLQHGFFVTRGTHDLSPERERSIVLLRYESKQKVC